MTTDGADQIQEGNRRFSVAMIAMEQGDFNKCERLLKETIQLMGNSHPTAMLAMKTLGGIASEQGRFEESLQYGLDLLDSQIATFGVNHAETSRTIRSILAMCKEQGRNDIYEDINSLVQIASEMERNRTTQSFKRLRTVNPDEEDLSKETLRYKIQKWIAGRLAWLLKKFPFLTRMGDAAPWLVVVTVGIGYGVLCLITMSHPETGVKELRKQCLEYSTTDDRRRLQFVSPYVVTMQIDSKSISAPFRVVGYDWQDVGKLTTASIVDKENWLIQLPEGLRDFNNNVYYRIDAPERDIVHQMKEVMSTSNYYYEHKQKYPSKMEKISETNFQYQNPWTKVMVEPSITSIRLDDKSSEYVTDFLFRVRSGATWPGEPPLAKGMIHACRISFVSRDGPTQDFIVHGFDRYGQVMTASEGLALLLQSEQGKDVDQRIEITLPQRTPTFWVFKVPPFMMPDVVPYLKYRFVAFFGCVTALFLILFVVTPSKSARAGAAVFFVCSLVALLVSLVGVYLP